MKLLLHPLLMPIYTLALYYEIERQSYVVNYTNVVWLELMLLMSILCTNMLTNHSTGGKSPITYIHAPIKARIINATALIIIYAATTFTIHAYHPYTSGSHHIMLVYIIPTLLNIASGDAAPKISKRLANTFVASSNAAPAAYIGTLSGFTIMIGYKTSTDTFWPFAISTLIMALHATYCQETDDETKTNTRANVFWYAIGIIQTAALMFCDL